jgi:hypothetical protein
LHLEADVLQAKIGEIRKSISALAQQNNQLIERAHIGSKMMLLPQMDGLGTKMLTLMQGLAYCRYKNLTYIHLPWFNVRYWNPRETNLTSAAWSKDLEDFTGLVLNETKYSEDLAPVSATYSVPGFDEKVDLYFNDDFLSDMRKRYLSGPYPKAHSHEFDVTKNTIRIAVHIRRGDIDGKESQTFRYTNNSVVLSFMELVEQDIRSTNQSHPISFHVYSEGKPENFVDLVEASDQRNVYLHLGDDLRMTFHDMVSADVLVMAKSGFSYGAALLSGGTVYHQSFWVPGLNKWKRLPTR